MRHTALLAEHYYHLYNRGVNHAAIFFAPGHWAFFLKRLREYARPEWIEVIAYCLMPNHYHLLVWLKGGDLSQGVMQPFTVSYTKAVNREQGRSGPIFEGPFQAVEVKDDDQLIQLSGYIHQNPCAAGLVAHPAEWAFSSYRDYVGLRQGTLPQPGVVLRHFASPADYVFFVESYRVRDPAAMVPLCLD